VPLGSTCLQTTAIFRGTTQNGSEWDWSRSSQKFTVVYMLYLYVYVLFVCFMFYLYVLCFICMSFMFYLYVVLVQLPPGVNPLAVCNNNNNNNNNKLLQNVIYNSFAMAESIRKRKNNTTVYRLAMYSNSLSRDRPVV
jgi:hypothetical protein